MGSLIQSYTDDVDGVNRILYNPTSGKILTAGLACIVCSSGTTPEKVKMTPSGVALCGSPGSCCALHTTYKVIRAPVDPINEMLILKQGCVKRPIGGSGGNTDFYVLERCNPDTCDLYAIKEGDYGDVEVYQSSGCVGYRATYRFHQKIYQVRLIGSVPESVNIYVYIMFGARFLLGDASYDVDWATLSSRGGYECFSYFHVAEPPEAPYANCLPYDAALANLLDCETDPSSCFGQGTVLLEAP